ncbi:MAG TPA: cupin domain-containing protein [Xanthobacteraceae bacterium]|nr:cupin domain-containing protein [Xanthobacteraceae bacterium]
MPTLDKWEETMNRCRLRTIVCALCTMLLGCAAGRASEIHRVITGFDAANKSTALFDSRLTLEVGKSGTAGAVLWMTDTYPVGFSQQDTAQRPVGIPPPANGTVLRVVEFPPADDAKLAKMDTNFMMKIIGDNAPTRGVPVTHPMMHRTRSVDYAIIMSGEIDMMLDDKTVHLKAGDVVVQQATNHAWINHGTQPCRVVFVLMDSKQP